MGRACIARSARSVLGGAVRGPTGRGRRHGLGTRLGKRRRARTNGVWHLAIQTHQAPDRRRCAAALSARLHRRG